MQDLITKAQQGDRGAFEELVVSCRGQLEEYVRLRLGQHLSQTVEVEDVLQEAFARAFRSVARFQWKGDESFLRWLKGIAEHIILEHAKRQKRRRVVYLEGDPAAGGVSPSKSLRREERFARFREALDGLSPDHRNVVILSRIHGLRIDEIARRMDRTPKAVSHLLARALRKLKEAFGETDSLHLPPWSLEEKEASDGE